MRIRSIAALAIAIGLAPPNVDAQQHAVRTPLADTTLAGERANFRLMLTGAVRRNIVDAAEAMPADKFGFAPTAGEFTNVRTFSREIRHLAATNYILAATALGESATADAGDEPLNALPELQRLIEAQQKLTHARERESGQIIPSVFHRNGRPIKHLYKAWHSACERAAYREKNGLREVVRPNLIERTETDPGTGRAKRVRPIPHDFRRTAVRNLERAGVPRSVAMKLVGHKTESMYRRYAIVSQRDLAEGVAKLALLRAPKPATSSDGHNTGTKHENKGAATVTQDSPQLVAM